MVDPFTEQEWLQILYVGIGIGVFVIISALARLMSPRESLTEARSRRMKMLQQGKTSAEVLAILKPDSTAGLSGRLPIVNSLADKMRRTGWTFSGKTYFLISVVAGILAGIAGYAYGGPNFALPAFAMFGLVVPYAVMDSAAQKRTEALTKQLPDALDLLARGLRVGHPLNTSVDAVAREMADPVGTEFGIIFDQVSYGDDLTDAFYEFAERVNVEDVRYLSSSIGIQHGSGGDLARVIEVLSRVIRGRISLRRKVHAITAEGRATAWLLSSLPFVMFGFTSWSSPDYYGGVSDHEWFMPMAMIVLGLTAVNALLLRKLVNFKV